MPQLFFGNHKEFASKEPMAQKSASLIGADDDIAHPPKNVGAIAHQTSDIDPLENTTINDERLSKSNQLKDEKSITDTQQTASHRLDIQVEENKNYDPQNNVPVLYPIKYNGKAEANLFHNHHKSLTNEAISLFDNERDDLESSDELINAVANKSINTESHTGIENELEFTSASTPSTTRLNSINSLRRHSSLVEVLNSKKIDLISYLKTKLNAGNELSLSFDATLKKPSSWSISAHNSVFLTSYKHSIAAEDRQWINVWNDSRTPLVVHAHQLSLNYNFSNKFSLHLGIEYQRIVEKFNWEITRVEDLYVYLEKAYYLDVEGERTWFGATVVQSSLSRIRRQSALTHKLYNIPIGLTYHSKVGKVAYGLKLSGLINVSHVFQGFVLNDEIDNAEMVEFDQPADLFGHQMDWAIEVEPFLGVSLTPNYLVTIGAGIRNYPNKWMIKGSSHTKLSLIKFNLGISRKF